VFSAPATERLQDSSIDEVVVTDTIPLPPRSASRGSRFCRSRRCSRAIKEVFEDGSVTSMFDGAA
jgi:ribose-phosphate pyrophosphokinase